MIGYKCVHLVVCRQRKAPSVIARGFPCLVMEADLARISQHDIYDLIYQLEVKNKVVE
jgi:hypothetical protein